MTTPMLVSSIHSCAQAKCNNRNEMDPVLDALQLIQLQWSFRQWVRFTSDYAARLERHRLLIVFLVLRHADACLDQVLALNLAADLVGRRIFLREPEGKGCSVREVVVDQPIAEEIRLALDTPELGQLLCTLHELSTTSVEQSIAERAEACGFPAHLCTPEMIRVAAARASVAKEAPTPGWHPLKRCCPTAPTQATHVHQNILLCHIEAMRQEGLQSQVQLSIATGQRIIALMSRDSAERLHLRRGHRVRAEVKAHAINLHLHHSHASSSADNCFSGNLVGMTRGRLSWECVVDIGGGHHLSALLSAHYAATLSLRLGQRVWVDFNSFAVIVHHEAMAST